MKRLLKKLDRYYDGRMNGVPMDAYLKMVKENLENQGRKTPEGPTSQEKSESHDKDLGLRG